MPSHWYTIPHWQCNNNTCTWLKKSPMEIAVTYERWIPLAGGSSVLSFDVHFQIMHSGPTIAQIKGPKFKPRQKRLAWNKFGKPVFYCFRLSRKQGKQYAFSPISLKLAIGRKLRLLIGRSCVLKNSLRNLITEAIFVRGEVAIGHPHWSTVSHN